MKVTTRARVAAAVGAATSGRNVSAVYDYSVGRHHNISAAVSQGRVTGYDYTTASHFSGSGSSLDFFDYHNSKHVQLKRRGAHFEGYDYDSCAHFSGTVSGNAISLYDYETNRHYNYSI